MYDASDERMRADVRRLIESMVDAYNRRDLEQLRNTCNYPLVRLDRLDWSEHAQPADLSIDFAAVQSRTGWRRSSVRYLDVRIPQSDDKVVATLTVARYAPTDASCRRRIPCTC